jgi:hypothetical protein
MELGVQVTSIEVNPTEAFSGARQIDHVSNYRLLGTYICLLLTVDCGTSFDG